MAIRRRFTRRFGFRRAARPQRVAWDSVVFNEANVAIDGFPTDHVLFDPNTQPVTPLTANTFIAINRTFFVGGITMTPAETGGLSNNSVALFWALMVIDDEELASGVAGDSIITSIANAKLNTERVLQVGCVPGHFRDDATVASGFPTYMFPASGQRCFGLRAGSRMRLRMKTDQRLVLRTQWNQDLSVGTGSSDLSEARLFGYGRTLFTMP